MMNQHSSELHYLIKFAENMYQPSSLLDVDMGKINYDVLINLASKNNTLYYIINMLLQLPNLPVAVRTRCEKICEDGKKKIDIIKKTLLYINEHFPHWVILKTYRGEKYVRIPNDIDVLTESFEADREKARKLGFSFGDYLPKEGSIHFLRNDLWKIHVHRQVSWAGSIFFDSKEILNKQRKVLFNDISIAVPNYTYDFLIHVAHMNFEPLHINLGELLYLYSIIHKVDLSDARLIAKEYHWQGTFDRTLRLFNSIHSLWYGKPFDTHIPVDDLSRTTISFPYTFSRGHLVKAVCEKKIFWYVLKKMAKVCAILLTHDTYSKYIKPADKETQ